MMTSIAQRKKSPYAGMLQFGFALFLLLVLLLPSRLLAEGSKDLYPYPGAPANAALYPGYRSYLLTSSSTAAAFNPYPNAGIQKVYAKAGERIYAGSSMVGLSYTENSITTTGSVAIYSPAGSRVAFSGTSGTTTGRIQNRTEELGGPNRTGVTTGYTPLYYDVTTDGVYEVRFTGTGVQTNIPDATPTDKYRYAAAAESWEQFTSYNNIGNSLILAWDVSVGNASTGVLGSGRVYSTAVNLTGPNSRFLQKSFYGKFYVTTPQGFVYEVDNNGQNGASFNFFSNNKGAVSTSGDFTSLPSYKSVNTTNITTLNALIWNPHQQDNAKNITNKIFYNKPDWTNLPATASVFYSGSTELSSTASTITGTASTTWLKSSPVYPTATDLVVDCEGRIAFYSNTEGRYEILIDANSNSSLDDAVDVVLRGDSHVGLNTLQWNGKNGSGDAVSLANITLKVRTTLAEVHFPFLDVESNYDGIKIRRMKTDLSEVIAAADTVFWNDLSISHTNSNATGGKSSPQFTYSGVKSSTNGHKWSTASSNTTDGAEANFYGQNQTLDTWTFVFGEATSTVKFGGCITISGSVWNDPDGDNTKSGSEKFVSGDNTSSATTVAAGQNLYAYLVNSEGNIVQKVSVGAGGTYSFDKAPRETSGLKIILSTESKTFGEELTASTPPTGWARTGESVGTNATLQTASGDGIINVTTAASGNIVNQNFGLQQLPQSAEYTAATQPHPGAGNSVVVPLSYFTTGNGSTPVSTVDYHGGTVAQLRLTEFPSGVDKIKIGTTTYTTDGSNGTTKWPDAGVTVSLTSFPEISVYPSSAGGDVNIPFAAIDNLGGEDPTPGFVKLSFSVVSISGKVWHDVNGDASDASENGAAAAVYANLTGADNKVIASVLVTDGAYSFSNVPGSTAYMVILTSAAKTTGATLLSTDASLPTGWVPTGTNTEVSGTPTANTSNKSNVIDLGTVAGNVKNANFGIQQPPVATASAYLLSSKPASGDLIPLNSTIAASGSGSKVAPPVASDPDATGSAPFVFVITSLPSTSGGTISGDAPVLLYNGTIVTQNDITNGTRFADPSLFSLKLNGTGYGSVTFEFKTVDAAGVASPSVTYSIGWNSALPVTLVSFTAKVEENTAVTLRWNTSQETNADHFSIERSANAKGWTQIGKMQAAGESRNTETYTFTDVQPLNGQNYYRLKMIDKDESFSYSRIVNVGLSAVLNNLTVYPNPVANVLFLKDTDLGTLHSISLMDVNGREVYKTGRVTEGGIDVSRYPGGTYLVKAVGKDGSQVARRIVISR